MEKVNFDSQLINNICAEWDNIKKSGTKIDYDKYPLDENIIKLLKDLSGKMLVRETQDAIYNFTEDVMVLWKKVVERSILCLRFFDEREPFKLYKEKVPVAYGIEELMQYFESFTEFESLLYGGSKHYRDHVIHSFRTWLLGLKILLNKKGEYLRLIVVGENIEVNLLEKLSIWGIISLTHDLGYPLEKAHDIIDKTKAMMNFFISNPAISLNLTFSGIQDNINDFILRLTSSKMIPRNEKCHYLVNCTKQDNQDEETVEKKKDEPKFVARLQPKYYFKLSKSLEKSKHGIISSIIVYKLLQYFLESDFSIDEDYYFDKEGARQFYIRREILRAIASHTCHDIYHQNMLSFSYLLIIVDDNQDWGRKRFTDFYFGSNVSYDDTTINVIVTKKLPSDMYKTDIIENVTVKNDEDQLLNAIRSQYKQSQEYKAIFKDGLDTKNRNFNLSKITNITYSCATYNSKFLVEFHIYSDKNADFIIKANKNEGSIDIYNKDWVQKVVNLKKNDEFFINEDDSGSDYKIWSIVNK